ncbi:hypothetical protein VNO77_24502 [Canavalia gladiata]|uniref:Uncharacterized protein n=1 Tax=Canavalia gladiata TaxID=3824 RepID=A0AAN9L6E5_CANGL
MNSSLVWPWSITNSDFPLAMNQFRFLQLLCTINCSLPFRTLSKCLTRSLQLLLFLRVYSSGKHPGKKVVTFWIAALLFFPPLKED